MAVIVGNVGEKKELEKEEYIGWRQLVQTIPTNASRQSFKAMGVCAKYDIFENTH